MLHTKQLQMIELILAHPTAKNTELAEMGGVNRNTVSSWKRNEEFQEVLKKRLREIWEDSEIIAVNTMRDLAIDGNFNASKYILDSLGYAPTQKHQVEADVKNDINITIGSED